MSDPTFDVEVEVGVGVDVDVDVDVELEVGVELPPESCGDSISAGISGSS